MSSPFLNLPGAVEATPLGVAEHYGHPLAESRALEEGRAIVDLSHEGAVKVTGADRLRWLHSMLSQSVENLAPGHSTEAFVLSPQGRVEYAFGVVDDGEATWLLTSTEAAAGLAKYLDRMRFMMRVEVSVESENYAQLLTFSSEIAEDIAARVPVQVRWNDPWQSVQPGGHQYAAAKTYDWSAMRLLIPRESLREVAQLVRAGELRVAGLSALEALEISAWRPGLSDVDERTIPHELDWLRTAVHMNKGCYRGQETIAKVHNLGHPPRRLTLLHLEGADTEMPAPGALIYAESERPVGRITRAALHHDLGPIAFALLKRSVPIDAQLRVVLPSENFCAAQQEVIVPPNAGATKNVPRLPRLG